MIDKNFEKVFKELRELLLSQSNSISHSEVKDYFFTDEDGNKLDQYDWDAIKEFFNSNEVDKELNNAMYGKSTEFNNIKSRMAMKAQSDLLDLLERETKLATKNRIRAKAHESARRLYAAEKTGPLKSGILSYIDNLNRLSV